MSSVPPTGPPADGATVRRAARVFIEVGHVLSGRYEIRRFLGRGAMGEVWLALDLKLRTEVALKDMAFRMGDLEMVRREVKSARDVASSNVCRVFDLIEIEGRELLSMEYVDGLTLRKVVEEQSPLAINEAHAIASQLLAGLEAIHSAGLVHRDVKPENVMITRTGRVVIMDFGLARDAKAGSGSVAGTPAYMSPEQERGDTIDPRTDLFAAGVILAELTSDARTREARANIWDGVRRRPVTVGDSPWTFVLRKAVSHDRNERFASARDMARAIDEATKRVATGGDKQPYPGLASFTEEQAEFFFGREAEVETILGKLDRFHLLGVIGPTGAGKTSLINAGLLPMLGPKWDFLVCRPASAPFINLGSALASKIEGVGLAAEMLRFHEIDTAVGLMRRWRAAHANVLVVIDQFEELFTLNLPDEQRRFADLIGRMILDADIRVLLCMRDDFLARCHEHERLAPVFAALTPLRAPASSGLRRALVEPALRSGYQFEDEDLIDEMVQQVGTQSGALPLLAFCAAKMWEQRDREAGMLLRQTYELIGGVSGALAQHAEEILDQIGTARLPTVREIFRNLVTGQGTRIARQRETLMSIFPVHTAAAKEVLDTLISARLLTSTEGSIEIIHESLLSAWPRLVQWRAQDSEGSILRDQLRQVAQLWDDRGRPFDLLWTGNSYREFVVWRTRYPGQLTAVEDDYSDAMVAHIGRRKRTARFAGVAVIVVAMIIAGIMAVLWRDALHASEQRLAQVRRAEAAKLLALAQFESDRFPTFALAYTTKSLEIHDTPEGRRLALDVLWRGPVASVLPLKTVAGAAIEFSPDGRWLSYVGNLNEDYLLPEDGGKPVHLEQPPTPTSSNTGFDPSGRYFVSASDTLSEIRIFSVPDGALRSTLRVEPATYARIGGPRLLTVAKTSSDSAIVRSWAYDGTDSIVVGSVRPAINSPGPQMTWARELDPSGSWTIFLRDGQPRRLWVGDDQRREEVLSTSWDDFRYASVSNSGEWLTGLTLSGIALKSLRTGEERRFAFPSERKMRVATGAEFDKPEKRVAWSDATDVSVWNLTGPPDAEARLLKNRLGDNYLGAVFHPKGELLATLHSDGVAFWPTLQPEVRIFSASYGLKPKGLRFSSDYLAFSSDGQWLATCSFSSGLSLIPLRANVGKRRDVPEFSLFCTGLAVHPDGRSFIASGRSYGVAAVPVEGPIRQISPNPAAPLSISGTNYDPTGRFVVAAVGPMEPHGKMHIWDLQTHNERRIPLPGPTWANAFGRDGRLYSAGAGGIRIWDVAAGTHRVLFGAAAAQRMRMSGNRRFLLAALQMKQTNSAEQTEPEEQELRVFDLVAGTSRLIATHGSNFTAIAINSTGDVIATADSTGAIRVGRASGNEPHLLLGHRGEVTEVSFSEDSVTLASTGADWTTRVWPVPDLSRTPLHLLPHDVLMTKLRALTNVRAIADEGAQGGYRIDFDPFPGWKTIRTW